MQQKLVSNKWFKLGVCVFLTLAVVVVFVLAPFATAHAIVGVDDAVIVILIAALAGCGITFASTGAFNTLEEYVGDLLGEYASDNNTTVFSLTNGLQSNSNKLGQILLNNRWIVLIQGFASWLKLEFGLANNNEYILQSSEANINNMTVYSLPLRLAKTSGNYTEYTYLFGDTTQYAMFCAGNGSFTVYIVSETSGGYRRIRGNNNGVSSENDYTLTERESGLFAKYDGLGLGDDYDPNNIYDKYTQEQITAALDGNAEIESGGVGISVNTGTVTLPEDKPGFQAGDGGILDVGADWTTPYPNVLDGIPQTWPNVVADDTVITLNPALEADIVEQVPSQTDIENLPGGSTFGLPPGFGNLRLADIWHYVYQWVVDTSVAGGLLWNTANAMASPVVNMVFAMVVIAIVFGTLKHLRSH